MNKATMDNQSASIAEAGDAADTQNISLRRLKKREIDRKCQREARKRKQSHIIHLESLVDEMRKQDSSWQVATLYKHLQRMEEERALLTKALNDIHYLVGRTISNREEGQIQGVVDSGESTNLLENNAGEQTTSPVCPSVDMDDPLSGSGMANDAMDVRGEIFTTCNLRPEQENVRRIGAARQDPLHGPVHRSRQQRTTTIRNTYGWTNPAWACCCNTHVSRQSGQRAVWQGNYWKFCVDVLDERFDWGEEVQPADDEISEDMLVRAMIEGWDAIAKRSPLHPSLEMLRRVDESMFGPIPKTERLAMLRAMHLLLQYHSDPTTERYKRLPPWYIYRPSQHIEHTYAIDYWAWPQFRQRFIFNEHIYCGNGFFRMYQDEMRILWPFEFRDCFTHDLESDLYKPSRLFDERINGINCWTMSPDFFKRFPELSSDIPTNFRSIPKSMPSVTSPLQRKARSSRANASVHKAKTIIPDAAEQEVPTSRNEPLDAPTSLARNVHEIGSAPYQSTIASTSSLAHFGDYLQPIPDLASFFASYDPCFPDMTLSDKDTYPTTEGTAVLENHTSLGLDLAQFTDTF